jgi:hypothetical protein
VVLPGSQGPLEYPREGQGKHRLGAQGGGNSTRMAIRDTVKRVKEAYARGEQRPLGGYAAALSAYACFVGAASVVGRRMGVRLPERVSIADTALMAVATHKASRLLTKSAVASAVRAPFTRYEEPAGHAEVNESVPGDGGVRHAVGELLTCPFCAGVWIVSGLTAGLVFAPRVTRVVASALTAVAASDALHLAYAAAQRAVDER